MYHVNAEYSRQFIIVRDHTIMVEHDTINMLAEQLGLISQDD